MFPVTVEVELKRINLQTVSKKEKQFLASFSQFSSKIEGNKQSFAARCTGIGARLILRQCSVLQSSLSGILVDRGAELLVEDCDVQNGVQNAICLRFLNEFFSFCLQRRNPASLFWKLKDVRFLDLESPMWATLW